jgi:heme/copper-type cytochrome/quinol oxidase subunit 4
MSDFTHQSDLNKALHNAQAEPLLPIEKKLIGFSLGIGLTLLVVLAAINHFWPAGT